MSHNNQKKIAVINDITGFGRCSMTVMLPIISALKVQCCPVPTAILSNHTEFPSFFVDDYTDRMVSYTEEWKKLNLAFQGIATGYLGSKKQIDIIVDFIGHFRTEDTIVIVDPVMGDRGSVYANYSKDLCPEMKRLAAMADILTPNVTESCILTGTPYKETWSFGELHAMANALSAMGPGKVVITGVLAGNFIGNFCCEKGQNPYMQKNRKVGVTRCGTGDVFSAILAADAVNGIPFRQSVKKAAQFVRTCILKSMELDIPTSDGVCFEEVLHLLR